MIQRQKLLYGIAGVAYCLAFPVRAQLVIEDKLTGASSAYDWRALNGACLTAGDNTGNIPACNGLTYYSGKTQVGGDGTNNGRLPDTVGTGALRLTNGDVTKDGSNGDNQTGAVVSNFTFPTNQGIQVTFATVTYGGDGNNGTGADGISFFLADGAQQPTVGGLGGSLGYSCSNGNASYDGVVGAYIGIGIDEYGNFANPGDNTNTGPGSNGTATGDNFKAGRIALRGAGNTAFAWLSASADYGKYYPKTLSDSDKAAAVKATCKSGTIWNYSGSKQTVNGKSISNKNDTGIKLPYNYPLLAYKDLPSGVTIANQQATSAGNNRPIRANATPITYELKITQDGVLDFSYSVNGGAATTVISDRKITDSNGPLPGSFRFGFSSGTGGSNNVHEITCFKAAPVSQSASSAGTNVQQSARVEAGTQLYLAYYHPVNWWGELTAQDLVVNSSTDVVSINPVANWNASCTLTGGDCQATNQKNLTAQGSANRSMLTWSGTAGVPFQWDNLSDAQKTALSAGDASATDARLKYLRGDRTNEIGGTAGGQLRKRSGLLGDVIDSSPTWVGPPVSPYAVSWIDGINKDAVAPEAATNAQTYTNFNETYFNRQNVVYIGANDGFLHGFRAGAYDAKGDFAASTSRPNDGREVLAYMPSSVLNTIHNSTSGALDFSSTQYAHNFFVDGTPGTGDLFYNGAWHTWLVGGTGPGGNSTGPVADKTTAAKGVLYALDITNPDNFAESNASTLVMGEWTSDTITCNVSNCGDNLGAIYGTPIIRRLHNGNWAALFGNGVNSKNGNAGMFVMMVDSATGAVSFRFLDTGVGAATDGTKNGIAYVSSADLDGDHITDYAYGGDFRGNLWRFDLTDADPTKWFVTSSSTGGGQPTPLFTTATGQPISTRVSVSTALGVGPQGQTGVIVAFGTGRQLPQTQSQSAQYETAGQSLYGIWDWNMASWNAKAKGSAQYASLAAPQTVTTAKLQAQSVTATGTVSGGTTNYRSVSASAVCWQGSSACTTGNTKFGWKLPLPASTEQVIYNPTTAYGMFIVNTTIPAVSQALSCTTQPASGYTMAVSIASGGASQQSFFADQNGNFVLLAGGIISGVGLSGTGTPSIVTANKNPYLVQQTVGGSGAVTKINPAANSVGKRLTWIKRR